MLLNSLQKILVRSRPLPDSRACVLVSWSIAGCSYRVWTRCLRRRLMARDAGAARDRAGLYIPGNLDAFRRSALRVAWAATPSTFR
jgi:hypothetical protein